MSPGGPASRARRGSCARARVYTDTAKKIEQWRRCSDQGFARQSASYSVLRRVCSEHRRDAFMPLPPQRPNPARCQEKPSWSRRGKPAESHSCHPLPVRSALPALASARKRWPPFTSKCSLAPSLHLRRRRSSPRLPRHHHVECLRIKPAAHERPEDDEAESTRGRERESTWRREPSCMGGHHFWHRRHGVGGRHLLDAANLPRAVPGQASSRALHIRDGARKWLEKNPSGIAMQRPTRRRGRAVGPRSLARACSAHARRGVCSCWCQRCHAGAAADACCKLRLACPLTLVMCALACVCARAVPPEHLPGRHPLHGPDPGQLVPHLLGLLHSHRDPFASDRSELREPSQS